MTDPDSPVRRLLPVAGPGRPDERLELDDIAVGPWAGSLLTVWAGRARAWHGDPDCEYLPDRTRLAEYPQPGSGSLADLVLPKGLHCLPPGERGAYLAAARALADADADTHDAMTGLARGDAPTSLFSARRVPAPSAVPESLAGLAVQAAASRQRTVERLLAQLGPRSGRLAVMLAAEWVSAGRTAGKHQARYDRFLDAGVEELERRGLRGLGFSVRHDINDEDLPHWLDDVGAGRMPSAATEQLAAGRAERYQRFSGEAAAVAARDGYRAAGAAWTRLLEGITVGHDAPVVALLNRDRLDTKVDVTQTLLGCCPHASVPGTNVPWMVVVAPGVITPLVTTDYVTVPRGLVLLRRGTYGWDADKCALLLRNLLLMTGLAAVADHVRAGTGTGDQPDDDEDEDEREINPATIPAFSDDDEPGLSYLRCLPALRAAQAGKLLKAPAPAPRRTRRT